MSITSGLGAKIKEDEGREEKIILDDEEVGDMMSKASDAKKERNEKVGLLFFISIYLFVFI